MQPQKDLRQLLSRQLPRVPTDILGVVDDYADPKPCLFTTVAYPGIKGLKAIALHATDGHLYLLDNALRCIRVISREGKIIRSWGSYGRQEGQFDDPSDLALDSKRNLLYISDFGLDRVHVFTTEGQFVRWFRRPRNSDYQNTIAVSSVTGFVFTASVYYHVVDVFTSNGDFLRSWSTADSICALSCGDESRDLLYCVTDAGLSIYASNGQELSSCCIVWPSNHWMFDFCVTVSANHIYCSANSDVKVFSSDDGVLMHDWTKDSIEEIQDRMEDLNFPVTGLLVYDDHSGHLYQVDRDRQRVLIWSM